MTRTRLIVLGCFVAALAAGIAVGVAAGRFARRPRHASWLERRLDLTPDQREQMRQIWSGVMRRSGRQQREQREALRRERDEAVQALLTEEQKKQYEEAMQTYARKSEALAAERRKAFDEAVERTKQILTEPQREKYEELLKQRAGWSRRRGHPGRGGGGPEAPPPPPHGGR